MRTLTEVIMSEHKVAFRIQPWSNIIVVHQMLSVAMNDVNDRFRSVFRLPASCEDIVATKTCDIFRQVRGRHSWNEENLYEREQLMCN